MSNQSVVKNAIATKNISKIFYGRHVIKDINLKITKGLIHGIIGENGAGKTVLVSILAGVLLPETGTIYINEQLVTIENTRQAQQVGIGLVQQHDQLIGTFLVWENIILGHELINRSGMIQKNRLLKKLTQIQQKYDIQLDLCKKTSLLSPQERQLTNLLKLLYQRVDIFIFDEPIALLNLIQAKMFFTIIKKLKAEGKTVILILHNIHDVLNHTDEITVLRKGKIVAQLVTTETQPQTLQMKMFAENFNATQIIRSEEPKKPFPVLLKIDHISIPKINNSKIWGLQNFCLQIKKGEIVGIAGMNDHGQNELFYALLGTQSIKKGQVFFQKKNITHTSIKARKKIGIIGLSEKRDQEALMLDVPVWKNIIFNQEHQTPFSRYGWMNFAYQKKYSNQIIQRYDIHGAHQGQSSPQVMSGGNRQKMVFARSINQPYQLLILFNPTQALDHQATAKLQQAMLSEKKKKKSIILISSNLEELMQVSDRIIVISHGQKISDELTKDVSLHQIAEKITLLNSKLKPQNIRIN